MTICPRCSNTGYLGDRFCSCPFAAILRDRIETAPEFAEFRRKRAEVDEGLRRLERNANAADHWRALGWLPGEISPPDNPEVN